MSAAAGMVIIGAGECGTRAAFALREAGYSGAITLLGEERLSPYERPPLSKRVDPENPGGPVYIRSEASYAESEIAHIAGIRVDAVDAHRKHVTLSSGEILAYDKLLLATGARPRRLAMAEGVSRAYYLRTYEDALAIAGYMSPGIRLAVIGAGFIGMELAAKARMCAADVTVLEVSSRILKRGVPVEIADIVHEIHSRAGVVIRCGVSLASITETGREVHIALASGEVLAFDAIVVGIGAEPVVDLARLAGLDLDNGIAVDEMLQTSATDIFAAGDCCSFPHPLYGGMRVRLEAWRNAHDHGTLVARNMMGANERISAVPWFWSDQYHWTLQVAGLGQEGDKTVVRSLPDGGCLIFHFDEGGVLVAAGGIAEGNAIARDMRICEMLIAQKAAPSIDKLHAPKLNAKDLLAD